MPTIEPTKAPNPPTLRPTPAAGQPTAAPTHAVTYAFGVTQNLYGIYAGKFMSRENNYEAFETACAMAMPPLTADNIAIDSVVNTMDGRRLTSSDAEVTITYTVTYTLAQTNYMDGQTAYNALTNSLNISLTAGLFDGYIEVVAALDNVNAPDLLNTTSTSFSAEQYQLAGFDDDHKGPIHEHTKVLVGVLVGLGGGLIFIGIIAWCIFGRGDESSPQGYSSPQSYNNNRAVEMTAVDPTGDKSAV